MSNTRPLNNRPGFIPIRENGTGWLLFRYDPARQLIEVQRRGVKTLVDLTEYAAEPKAWQGADGGKGTGDVV